MRSSEQFRCPSCGDRDHMATIEKVEAYSELDDKGEFTGTTDYDGDHETVGIVCRVCGWTLATVPRSSRW